MRARLYISHRFSITVALILASVALLLTFMSTISYVSHYLASAHLSGSLAENALKPLNAFQVDRERSFPTLYAALLWLVCSTLLAGVALSGRTSANRYVMHWGALAVIFLYLFADELLQVHEEVGEPLRNVLGSTGFLYAAWVIPASVLLLVLGILYARFVLDLPARTRRLFMVAGSLFVMGAIGLEMIGGYYVSSSGQQGVGFIAVSTVEELFEMLGITVFVYALVEYMRQHVSEITIPPFSKKS